MLTTMLLKLTETLGSQGRVAVRSAARLLEEVAAATIASGRPTQSLFALACRLLTCLCRKASHPSSITSSLVCGNKGDSCVCMTESTKNNSA
jgi:hypothetical protein